LPDCRRTSSGVIWPSCRLWSFSTKRAFSRSSPGQRAGATRRRQEPDPKGTLPEVGSESVRTLPQGILVGSPCPICGQVALTGRQTVCSAACRRERSRQRREESVQAELGAPGMDSTSSGLVWTFSPSA
jgi:hypothetical protein